LPRPDYARSPLAGAERNKENEVDVTQKKKEYEKEYTNKTRLN
jgi:hypothetical protein